MIDGKRQGQEITLNLNTPQGPYLHQHVTTDDGSPTLASTNAEGVTETMHHRGGALSETLYIYGPAITLAVSRPVARVMSLGLGLGYNEILAAALCPEECSLRMITFEMDPSLTESFLAWIHGSETSRHRAAYEWIENQLLTQHRPQSGAQSGNQPDAQRADFLSTLSASRPRERLRTWLRNGQFEVRGRFPEALATERFHAFLYDAFSRKMSDNLWSEFFLTQLLNRHAEADALFATYAATGDLRRALKKNQFEVIARKGFAGKKESLLGARGVFRDLGLARELALSPVLNESST